MAAVSPGKNVTLVARGREGRAALIQRLVAQWHPEPKPGQRRGHRHGDAVVRCSWDVSYEQAACEEVWSGGCPVFSG